MIQESITSGARAVLDLARHMDVLRERAEIMAKTIPDPERGYFTPSEDEQVRHLLVSYWQSRCALLEVIERFRRGIDLRAPASHELKRRTFLVGYAAAILLVDAARFLRQNCSSNPVIEAKLNEGEPHFGIAPGLYDTIQESLTSPANAWHLYHANGFYDRNQDLFSQDVAHDALLGEVLELVRERGEQVRVSKAVYARARAQVRANQLIRTLRDQGLGRAMSCLLELGGRMMSHVSVRPGHCPALPANVETQLGDLLRPGDVLITRKEYAATNYFLPGFWPHAALYLGHPRELEALGIHEHENARPRWQRLLDTDGKEPRRVLEAMGDGVWIRSLRSPFDVDAVAVIRPRLETPHIAEALARGLFHEGKPYDFDFDFSRSDRLVCTEVVYRSFEGVGGLEFQLTSRAGRLNLSAEDLLEMALTGRGFEPVAVFAPQECGGVACGAEASRVLERTLGAARSDSQAPDSAPEPGIEPPR